MAVIVVRVGTEEKEISGLTRKTTCAEVLEALFKDEQTFRSLNRLQESISNENIRDMVKNYAIMEDWRGCEKALSPQTKILAVWRAWGEEQCNVKFLLKKYNGMGFNEMVEKRNCDCGKSQIQRPQSNCISVQFLSKLSHEQKKRIRRNMMQYQQAILSQQSRITPDNNNNNTRVKLKFVQNKRNSKLLSTQPPTSDPARITLSEEQFVDGVMDFSQTLCDFARNSMVKKIYKEHCNYRRPHHRRHIPDGLGYYPVYQLKTSPVNSHVKFQNSNRTKSKRRSSAERKIYKDDRGILKNVSHRRTSQSSHNSSDSLTSVKVPNKLIELEARVRFSGDDADDEKSVLTEYGSLLSRQKLTARSEQLHPNIDGLGNTTLSTSAVTVADSSTTTSSDISNTSSSSLGTTSSDTSASSTEIYNENFFAKRAAAMAAAKAIATEKNKNSGPLKLFKIAKPSFMKKKRPPQSIPINAQPSLSMGNQCDPCTSEKTVIKQNQPATNGHTTEIKSASTTTTTFSSSIEQHLQYEPASQDEYVSTVNSSISPINGKIVIVDGSYPCDSRPVYMRNFNATCDVS